MPAFVPLDAIVFDRLLTVSWNGDTQIYATGLPSRPPAIDTPWSEWMDPRGRNMAPIAAARAIAVRFRTIRRVPPGIARGSAATTDG